MPQWAISTIFRLASLLRLPLNRYPLYRPGTLDNQPVFILACGRSGNTLLRSMLTAGDELAIPPESYVLPKVIRLFRAYNFLPWNQLCSLVLGEFQAYKEFYTWKTDLGRVAPKLRALGAGKRTLANILDLIYREYAVQTGFQGERWGDKTPINSIYANRIAKVFPQAHYIHLVRDPRAVAVSYREAGLYPDLESGALFWREANKTIENVAHDLSIELVSYESLVTNPKQTLQRLCTHCGIHFSDAMVEHHRKASRLGDTAVHSHHKNTLKALTPEYMDKWRKTLSGAEIEGLNQTLSKELSKFGYR